MAIVDQRRRRPREPQRIADVVSRLMARRGYAQVESLGQICEMWRGLIGEKLAKDSRPAGLKRGVLEVAVRSSVILQELSFRKRRLLREIKKTDFGGQIRDLRFRVAELD